MNKQERKQLIKRAEKRAAKLNDRIHKDCYIAGYVEGFKYAEKVFKRDFQDYGKKCQATIEQAQNIIKKLLWDLRNKDFDPAKDIEEAERYLGRIV